MTSSMLSGERRWASSSRKGGMTVLGKVAVPKPINLPSQRLENHGVDPNVEIVPKGTLSWGSRSSSSASNAWGSSSLSPNTDGGTGSPSHLSARPSSGGSGTRPSTAGSDRALESSANTAWGSSSRPSSASGSLTSNQTSLASLRPRSAETRPGSSQLSRFAESSIENSGAWSAAKTAERLGVSQPKNDGFSLSSGDFPTLGSDKDKSVLNPELQDNCPHARPGSSSGLTKARNETSVVNDIPANANAKVGAIDSWRRDYQVHSEDDVRPGIEKWKGNNQPYPNAGVPHQHYDAWHGPSVNNPQGGVWFRSPPGGPPFGNPVPPGGFPIEPFPYYRPHIPPAGLINPPPVPPLGTGPRGHPNNDVYRPHIPDAYIRPGIPIRPGFFPGPMAYEGYYSPPMGYCNTNERDLPFIGMTAGPPVYNRYSNQNPPEPSNSECRSGGYSNAGKPLASEKVESSHPPDTGGPYRVLLKHHESDARNEQPNQEDSETTSASYVDRRDQPRMTVWENEQRPNYRKNEEMDMRRSGHGEEASSQALENQISGSVILKAKFPDSSGIIKKSGEIPARKLDGGGTASDMLEIPPRSSAPKDSSLIQQIEGLNAKARDNSSARNREEQRNTFHAHSAPLNHMENEAGAGIVFPPRTHATKIINPPHCEVGASGGEKIFESLSVSGTTTSRITAHGIQGRGDHRNKGKLSNQDDGWRKKPVIADTSASSGAELEASDVLIGDHRISFESYDRSGSYNSARCDGESVQTRSDPVDVHDQRAKIKELAKQRTRQLQEEEEERTRKQKAKALAKLDELNRRSQAMEVPAQKESATSSDIPNNQLELQPSESAIMASKSGAVNSDLNCDANTVSLINDTSIKKVEKLPILSSEQISPMHKSSGKEPLLIHNQSVNMPEDVNAADARNASQDHNNIASKHRRMSYKQKQNLPSEKLVREKVASTTGASPRVENHVVVDVSVPSGNVTNEVGSVGGSTMVESSINQKKKNNRFGKNKQKVEESFAPPSIPKEVTLPKSPIESDKAKTSDVELDKGPLHPSSFPKDSAQYLGSEESHGRMNSQWKSQHSRRPSRSMQANRPVEKSQVSDAVMWAPVKPQNKTEVVDESDERSKMEAVNPVKSDQQVHNLKNKRAEMERYIPKPVAKEMAQQGSIQQPVASSISHAPAAGIIDSVSHAPQITQVANSTVGKTSFGMVSKHRDGRHTKQGKQHGSWQQRNQSELINVQDGQDHDSNSDTNVQRPSKHHEDQKFGINLGKGQPKQFNESSDFEGSNNSVNHDSAAQASVPVIKDHGAADRGRRVPFRGHRGVGVNHDVDQSKNVGESERNETHASSSEHSVQDIGASATAPKENRSVGEQLMSHWQPKSQVSHNQRGNRPSDQNVGEDKGSITAGEDKESNAHLGQPLHNQSVSEKSKTREAPHFGNQESRRERKNAPAKRRPNSPNQVNVISVEQAPTSVDHRHEHRPSSVFGKNGNQNRSGRGHESRGDWKSSGQDNRHYNQATNRERQVSNQHYEYHPVGPYDDKKSDNLERPKDGNHGVGRYRGRGQIHSRRGGGNLYGRQGGGGD